MNPDDFEARLERQPLRAPPEEWRDRILAAATSPARPRSPFKGFGELSRAVQGSKFEVQSFRSILTNLLWPCPQAWAGLAAIWLVLLAVNLTTVGKPETVVTNAQRPTPEMILVLKAQQREFARLIGPLDEPVAEPPKSGNPRPRGEGRSMMAFA